MDKKIGSNKSLKTDIIRLCALITALIMTLTAFFSCGGDPAVTSDTSATAGENIEPATDTGEAFIDADGDFIISENGNAMFTIMRGNRSPDSETAAALLLNNLIKEKTGKPLPIDTDFLDDDETHDPAKAEIIIGTTNYEESAKLKEKLSDGQFAICVTGNKIVIDASDGILFADAMTYFVENCIKEKSAGVFTVDSKLDFMSKTGIDALGTILRKAEALDSSCDQIMTVPAPGNGIKIPQGGCFDGKYFYQLFILRDNDSNEANNIARIVKVDAATGKTVLTSGDLSLNHGNDITYNPKINKLIVVHNNPNRSTVSLVDPETLTVTGKKTLPVSIYCMDYNAKRDLYVVGLSGGQDFRYLDADFKTVGSKYSATSKTKGYVTQGMACTDDFIFFVLYEKNVITVYDWNGKLVTIIDLDIFGIEPENISVHGNNIYVICSKSGATVFKVTPKLKKN